MTDIVYVGMFCETSKVLILATIGSHRREEVGGVENTWYNTTSRVHIILFKGDFFATGGALKKVLFHMKSNVLNPVTL